MFDRRSRFSLITAWSFLRCYRPDPNRDPNAEMTGQYRADTVDAPLSRKCAKGAESVEYQHFPPLIVSSHAGGHWFESSSLHQKVPDFARNQELFLFMSSNSEAKFLHFLLDPNRDPKAEMTGEGRMASSAPLPTIFLCLHRLTDDVSDGVGGVTFHLRCGVGVGAEGEARVIVSQRAGQCLDVHAVLEGQRGEGVPEVMEAKEAARWYRRYAAERIRWRNQRLNW